MNEQDSVKLLRECDAGARMGAASIADVLDRAESPELRRRLADSKTGHEALGREIRTELERRGADGKAPGTMAETISWVKTEAMLLKKDNDAAIADVMTDGCGMGVKSLSRCLNQYRAADDRSKDLAGRLIRLEQGLCDSVREYL